jgi:hypothetical protein
MSTLAIQRARPAGLLNAAVATAQIFPDASSPLLAAFLSGVGSGRLEMKRFEVRASGRATTAGAFTVAPTLYIATVVPVVNPLLPASWTVLATGAPVAVGTTTAAWMIQGEFLFDSVSGKLQGTFETNVANTITAKAALAATFPGVSGVTEPPFVLAVGLTFSGAGANIGQLADFCLDA